MKLFIILRQHVMFHAILIKAVTLLNDAVPVIIFHSFQIRNLNSSFEIKSSEIKYTLKHPIFSTTHIIFIKRYCSFYFLRELMHDRFFYCDILFQEVFQTSMRDCGYWGSTLTGPTQHLLLRYVKPYKFSLGLMFFFKNQMLNETVKVMLTTIKIQ